MSDDFGPRPEFAWLLVERFIVDEAYQRKIESPRSRKLIAKIAKNFNWDDFGTVSVSPREGGWYAVREGQHRIEAAKIRKIPLVPAMMSSALSVRDEARSFVNQNTDRVPVDVFTLHRARLVQGDDERANRIDDLVREAGLVIPSSQPNRITIKAGEVVCINVLGMLLDRYDWATALAALQSVATAYRGEVYGIRAPFLLVAAKLLSAGEADQAALASAFAQSAAAELFAQSGELGQRNVASARIAKLTEILRERLRPRRWPSENPIPQLPDQPKEVMPYEPDELVEPVHNASAPVIDAGADIHPSNTSKAPSVVPRYVRPQMPIIDRPQFSPDDPWTFKRPDDADRMKRR